MIETIETKNAPTPNGDYSQVVVLTDTIYVACQLGFAGEEKVIPLNFHDETLQCLNNVKQIIVASG